MYKQQPMKSVIMEMLSQRGYTSIEENTESNEILAEKKCGDTICVFLTVISKLNVAEIQNRISELQDRGISHGLIIYSGTPTPTVKNVVARTSALGITIELFNSEDLQFNITKHRLVPLHTPLSKEEVVEFKATYGTSIPVLLRSDPVCRFYDFSKGDIIKITRKDGFVSYRIVK